MLDFSVKANFLTWETDLLAYVSLLNTDLFGSVGIAEINQVICYTADLLGVPKFEQIQLLWLFVKDQAFVEPIFTNFNHTFESFPKVEYSNVLVKGLKKMKIYIFLN